MMLYIVIAFLWLSILLYLLFGGADFGAGILELFTRERNRSKTRRTMYRAIGPIWEANHMWLIIAIVILFVGFPQIYSTLSIYLHIPLTLMLLGIIARGTAFTFRHYDAVHDEMQTLYNRIYTYSSCVTPFFLGIIAGSTVSGSIDPGAKSFKSAYIFGWLHPFPVSTGVFTACICAYLAAVYLIAEPEEEMERLRFIAKTKTAALLTAISGSLVFLAAYAENIPLAGWIFGNLPSIMATAAAGISLVIFWICLRRRYWLMLRILAGFQITMILFGATYIHFPNLVLFKGGQYLSLVNQRGNDATIQALGWALLIGSVFILPALVYLIYKFQHNKIDLKSTA